MSSGKPWTAAEDALILAEYATVGAKRLVPHLPGRSEAMVSNRAVRLGTRFQLQNRTKWSPAEDAMMRAHYPSHGADSLAQLTGRGLGSVRMRANALGLVVDKAIKVARMRNARWGAAPAKGKSRYSAPIGEAYTTDRTKVTIAPPFVDRRWMSDDEVPKVVDSAHCRDWASAVFGGQP